MRANWIIFCAKTGIFLIALPLLMLGNGLAARAVTLYWDNDGNAGNNNITTGAGLGGNGSWDTSSLKWFNGTSDIAWTSSNDAIFWGTSGTITQAAGQTVNSLTFKTSGYDVTASTLTLVGSSVTVDTGADTIDAAIAGSAGLVKNGTGALHLGFTSNTYTGGTTINAGTLGIVSGALGTLPVSPAVNVTINNNAALRFNSSHTINVNRQIALGTGGGTINTNGFSGGIAGVISGTSLTKTSTGTLTLTNSNTYTDGTTISGGTLLANNTAGSATGTGAVAVNSGAVLGGTGTISGAVTVNSGGHIAPGASIESLDVGSLTLATGSVLDYELNTVTSVDTSDLINVTTSGGLTINGGTLNLANAGSMTNGTYKLIDYSGTLNGNLSNLAIGTTPSGFTYSLVNNAGNTSIDLVVGIGDFNGDGVVDAADYVVWRQGLGTTYTATDYTVWRSHFGQTVPAGAGGSLTAVPEPAAWLLLSLGSTMLVGGLGRWSSRARA